MHWDVETPSRCIFLADAASMRHRRKRLEIRDETLNTRPERTSHLASGFAAVNEGANGRAVSPKNELL